MVVLVLGAIILAVLYGREVLYSSAVFAAAADAFPRFNIDRRDIQGDGTHLPVQST
jgi:hypothetical protein